MAGRLLRLLFGPLGGLEPGPRDARSDGLQSALRARSPLKFGFSIPAKHCLLVHHRSDEFPRREIFVVFDVVDDERW